MKKQVFILAGQSNMSGRGGVQWYHGLYLWDDVVPDECAPSPSILRLSVDLNWEEARDPLHIDIESKSKTCGVGPGMSFANCLLKEIGCTSSNIGLVPCAVGGTAIKEWEKGSKLYNQMVQRAKAAAEIGDGGEIKAVLWYQGESDTDSDHASKVYEENLKKFIEDVRSDLGLPYLPFIQVALASGSERNIEKNLKIGEGGYGSLYKAVLHNTTVALKVLKNGSNQG
ncbi:putative carbohydrate esterase [Carex littledalei]|uniref:Putative carbohydrate esterase n=1 Tax=Carex littledalei TaxID=544730 RepID=A0A833QKV9_9POAL|nr:putative carbohydrate esterase [Carex littledalei]